ncbi:MAG: MFS transporter [Bacteroidetes bacterium]|nr:MAG: MFS transporter [Bacteroidota bacterium]TNE98888.1 MAG: MFS transporter [Bacteroidota bacterium]
MKVKFLPAYLLTFVNVLGFSILMPILPFVVKDYGAPEWMYGLLLTCYSAFQFIGAPYLGALSDAIGRKPVLIISQAGTLLSWFVFVIALLLPNVPVLGLALPLWIVMLSRILDGITGGNSSVTNAYISDITTRDEKSYIFGYLGGIAGIGMIIGPGLGGLSASTSLGFFGTMFVAIFISSITLISLFAWLNESLPHDKRRERKKQTILNTLFIPKRVKEVQPSYVIKVLFTVKFFFTTMMAFYIGTIALYLIDTFGFNEKELGLFLLIVGVFLAFNQAVLSKLFVKQFGEYKTLLIGLSFAALGLFSITITNNLWLFVSFYYIMNLGLSLCFPMFNALISQNADPKKQGEIMGISESINSFTMALFPVVAATLYGMIGYHLYHFVSILPVTAFILALIGARKMKTKKPDFDQASE